MKLFSKIIYIFIAIILFVPSNAFAIASYQLFDAGLAFNGSCQIVVDYKVVIAVAPVNTMTPGNIFKISVTPLDIVTDQPSGSPFYQTISVPLDGAKNGSFTITNFTTYQPYKVLAVEYGPQNNTPISSSNPINITPAVANCGSENGGGGGSNNNNNNSGGGNQNNNNNSNSSGSATSSTGGSSTSFNIDIDNPISVNSIPDLVQKILEGLIKIGIPLLVIMIVYSGFLYLFARGEPSKISAAHDMLKYTLIGGAILLGAWALAQLIHTTLIEITASIIQYFV